MAPIPRCRSRMGYSNEDMTAHGFRAMARTMAAERLNVQPEVIEAQLAHTVPASEKRDSLWFLSEAHIGRSRRIWRPASWKTVPTQTRGTEMVAVHLFRPAKSS